MWHVVRQYYCLAKKKKSSIHLGGSSRSIYIYKTHREVILQNILPCIRWFPVSNQSRDTKSCGFSCFSSVPPQQFRNSTFTLRHDRFLPHPSYFINIQPLYTNRGTWCRSWFRHCATSRRVESSITYGVKGIFHLHNPPGHTMALGSTQPLTEISTRNTFWGVKDAGA